MTFRDAAGIVPYLEQLGISHLYASPCLKARAGSPHGYAVVDYTQLNPELGGADDYRAMVEALHGRGMGQILDVVPNHMSATPAENLWWDDVLENGPASPYAAYFDIDWRPIKEELRNKILLPILGDQYGQVLESGESEAGVSRGAFCLRYFQSLPADRAAVLPDDPHPRAGRVEGNPAAGLRGRARIGEHHHRAGAPARSGGNRAPPPSPNGNARRK